MRKAVVLLLALSACYPRSWGNQVVERDADHISIEPRPQWSSTSQLEEAYPMADEHCARHGKKAYLMHADRNGPNGVFSWLSFECRE